VFVSELFIKQSALSTCYLDKEQQCMPAVACSLPGSHCHHVLALAGCTHVIVETLPGHTSLSTSPTQTMRSSHHPLQYSHHPHSHHPLYTVTLIVTTTAIKSSIIAKRQLQQCVVTGKHIFHNYTHTVILDYLVQCRV
jgi:hypothetical protein